MTAATILGIPLLLLALAGIGYTVHALLAVARFARRAPDPPVMPEPVTMLKPLHGPEPRLGENLATFLDQDWPAPIQLVAGVADAADPAIAVARALPQEEGRAVTPVVDATAHGPNAKIGNLVNMAPFAAHDLLVLSDSDMAAPRDYLSILAAALAAPDVGAVTCVYRGRGDAGRWSVLAAAAISYQFLPQLLVGIASGLARPGMGSTIALRRSTLEALGGLSRFANSLADDYELGEAVRALGSAVVLPRLVLIHGCAETSLRALWRHELRWAATIRAINLPGHLGTILTYPTPFALLLLPCWPTAGALVLPVAMVSRFLLARAIDRLAGAPTAPLPWLPARDLLCFAVFLASFLTRSVDWRGARLTLRERGRIAPGSEPVS